MTHWGNDPSSPYFWMAAAYIVGFVVAVSWIGHLSKYDPSKRKYINILVGISLLLVIIITLIEFL